MPKEPKVAVDSCFAIIVASSERRYKRRSSAENYPLRPTESRDITCLQEGKSQSVALMSRKEDIGRTKPTCLDKPCKMYSISDL